MLYTPPSLARPGEITITPWSYQSLATSMFTMTATAPVANAWPTANTVIFVPFTIPEAMTVTKMFCGIANAAGNIDLGIYNENQTLVISIGTTIASGSNTLQVLDITDTTLARGRYYMAMVADTVVTLTIISSVLLAAGICQSMGLLQQASVTLPLSTNANPAVFAKYTQAYVPYFGVQGYRTIGP